MTLAAGSDRLVTFLQDEVGEGLRAVLTYTPEAAEFAYLRDDLRGRVNLTAFEPTIAQARELHRQLSTVGRYQGQTLGHPLGNVSVFERSIVFVMMYDADHGVIATLDRDVGRNLAAFVEDCSRLLRSSSAERPSS